MDASTLHPECTLGRQTPVCRQLGQTRLRFGPIKDYARAMAIAGLETWCYRQAFPGAANGQPQYVVVT